VKLAEYQRSVLHASFALEPPEAELARLGDAERFHLYRRMIRGRLREMAAVAFKQSLAALGEAGFEACFDQYLAAQPPRSPFIRDVIADFGPFARAAARPLAGPPYLADLLCFEEAKWRVAYAPVRLPKLGEDGVRELDFEGKPVLNPSLALLALEHAVHSLFGSPAEPCASTPEAPPAPGPLTLLVYRPPAGDDVRWYAAEPLLASILRGARAGTTCLADLVRAAAAELGLLLDAALLENLASALTVALSRGVVIGVR
jgi:hypothetical protein